jgi:hypothetical protein
MPRTASVLWENVTVLEGTEVKCNHCHAKFHASSVTRVRDHYVASGSLQTCKATLPAHIKEAIESACAKADSDAKRREANAKAKAAGEELVTGAPPAKRQRTLEEVTLNQVVSDVKDAVVEFIVGEGLALEKAESPLLVALLKKTLAAGARGVVDTVKVTPSAYEVRDSRIFPLS